jgi:hypothetical protein
MVMERDVEERSVKAPPALAKELKKSKKARERWEKLAFTHKNRDGDCDQWRETRGDAEAAVGKSYAGFRDGGEVDGIRLSGVVGP